MKLPSYRYTATQQLAKRDPRAAMANINVPAMEAAAESSLIRSFQEAAGDIYDTYQKVEKAKAAGEYNEAWIKANYAEQDLRASLEGGTIKREEVERLGVSIPTNMQNVDNIPTNEVYLPYYEARMAEIKQQSMEGIGNESAKARFENAWTGMSINMRNNAIRKHIEKNKEVAEASFNRVLREHIKSGNEAMAGAAIDQMQAMDVIDLTKAEKLRKELPKQIDQNQINNVLIRGNEESIRLLLDNLRSGVYRIDSSETLSSISKANTRLNQFEKETEDSHKLRKKQNAADAFLGVMQGALTPNDLRNGSHLFAPEDQMRLYEAAIRQQKGTGFNDPTTLTQLRVKSEAIMFPPQGISMTAQATETLRSARDAWINGQITKESYDELKSSIDDNRNAAYRTEDYKTVETTIAKTFGVSVDRLSLLLAAESAQIGGASALRDVGAKERMAAQALEDLRSTIRLQGMELDPMEWWTKNKSNYSLETSLKGASAQFDASYGAIKTTTGEIDVEATRKKVFEQEMRGEIDATERERRINMLDGVTYGQ